MKGNIENKKHKLCPASSVLMSEVMFAVTFGSFVVRRILDIGSIQIGSLLRDI